MISTKKIIQYTAIFALCLVCSTTIAGPNDSISPDSNTNPSFIKKKITYSQFYPFIQYYRNYFEWKDSSAILPFFEKLKQTPHRKLKILHIGDSHLQADVFTGEVRGRMQNMFGAGGRGFIFPYSAAQTHSAYNYRNFSGGEWDYAKNVQHYPSYDLGLTGATIHTKDSSAWFKFAFTPGVLRSVNNTVKIYVKNSSKSFDLKVLASSFPDTIFIDVDSAVENGYANVKLPSAADTLQFFVHQSDSTQNFLECYGLLLESDTNTGVLYNSVGINGAGYKSILKEELFNEQISELDPDLVIIDLGGNDFYPGRIHKADVKRDLKKIIHNVRGAIPNASILINNTHDLYKRRRNIIGCMYFSELTREVAFEERCALYDYYQVSGGRYSMLHWQYKNLARRDGIHLSLPGYLFKAELFTNALLNSYHAYLTRDSINTFVADTLMMDSTLTAVKRKDSLQYYSMDTILARYEALKELEPYEYKGQGKEIYYKIDFGENLGSIAEKFGVSINDIKLWNNIRGTRIIAGQTLIIYTTKEEATKKMVKNKPAYVAPKTGKKVIYTIQPGDNLGNIASKHNVKVKDIISWNNLKGTTIYAGKKLEIYGQGNSEGNTTGKTIKKEEERSHNKNIGRAELSGRIKKYTVKEGDTLWEIARKYDTSVNEIKKANGLENNNLKIGMVLMIK